MKLIGLHPLASPFVGHGVLTLNGRSTDKLRGMSVKLVLELINAMAADVSASLDDKDRLVLDSGDKPLVIAGHQDVLDTLGLVATGEQ